MCFCEVTQRWQNHFIPRRRKIICILCVKQSTALSSLVFKQGSRQLQTGLLREAIPVKQLWTNLAKSCRFSFLQLALLICEPTWCPGVDSGVPIEAADDELNGPAWEGGEEQGGLPTLPLLHQQPGQQGGAGRQHQPVGPHPGGSHISWRSLDTTSANNQKHFFVGALAAGVFLCCKAPLYWIQLIWRRIQRTQNPLFHSKYLILEEKPS